MAIDDKSMQPLYKALIENTRDIIVLLNREGVVQYVSPSVERIFGKAPDEIRGTDIGLGIHPEDLEQGASALNQVLAGEDLPPYIVRFRHKDGTYRYVEVIAHNLDQSFADVMLTARDVTAFEESTKARRLVDESFEAAFHASSAINSISIVETSELVTVNDGWCEALGWSRQEAIGKTALELNIWGSAENRKKAVAAMQDSGRLRGYRTELTTRSGETCVVLLDATFLNLPVGTRLYFSALDITEQEKTEEKLRQSQRLDAIGHLTGGIAHDFNNLLSVIMGHVELARTEPHLTDQTVASLEAIFRASTTGATLIQQLLAFSRRQRLSPTAINLPDHLHAMRPLLQTTIAKDIELNIISHRQDCACLIDPLQLDNAILNLTINARDAMPGGGKLDFIIDEVTLSETDAAQHDLAAGDYIELRVSDTGVGMSEDSIRHAFEPFYTTKQEKGGSGLGLSMVFGFIRQSGGTVKIEPQPVGTSIVLLLPSTNAVSEQHDQSVVKEAPPLYDKQVLLVEDSQDVRELVAHLLESLSLRVTSVASSEEAEAIKHEQFDLLVCDLMLSGEKKGTAIAADFRLTHPDLAVLFMSGYQQGVMPEDSGLTKKVSFIQKPFTRSDFSAAISKLLGQQSGH